MKIVFHTVDQGIFTYDVPGPSVLVGRGSSCDVILKSEGVSRQHCRIDLSPKGELSITDLGSTNGVMIDNERIPINVPVPYSPWQPLAIGAIPQVMIEVDKPTSVEKETVTKQINLTLEIPQRSKKKINRRELNKIEPEIVNGPSPGLIIGIALVAVLVLTYLFFL